MVTTNEQTNKRFLKEQISIILETSVRGWAAGYANAIEYMILKKRTLPWWPGWRRHAFKRTQTSAAHSLSPSRNLPRRSLSRCAAGVPGQPSATAPPGCARVAQGSPLSARSSLFQPVNTTVLRQIVAPKGISKLEKATKTVGKQDFLRLKCAS